MLLLVGVIPRKEDHEARIRRMTHLTEPEADLVFRTVGPILL